MFILWHFCMDVSAIAVADSLQSEKDTGIELGGIEIVGYLQPQLKSRVPTSVGVLTGEKLKLQSPVSMIPAMNTIPGVRMEERSPGSYRLSVRGSLVRSPYGVRNVKIYYNDFALTDAGGNTYLNVLSVNDLQKIEILKGPDGSLFGANSGGVVQIKSNTDREPGLELKAYGGSYGLIGNSFCLARNSGNHFWTLRQSYHRADGYRENTKNHRLFLQVSDQWEYVRNHFLEAYLFCSDLDYQTPGGLTEEQYLEDPRQSRPSTPVMPGSKDQKTRISTKMYFGGIRHTASFSPRFSHTLSLWGNHVDFVYPFITNYEIRKENNVGFRTYFTFTEPKGVFRDWMSSLNGGFEWQRLVTDAYNYDNHAGVKGDIQAYDDIVNLQYFGFLRGRVEWKRRLTAEAAVSLNYNHYHFRDTANVKNRIPAVWMPHLALNYKITDPVSLRFIVSKGYSHPTTAELRPSDNKIYKELRAEQGWNTEVGMRLNFLNGRFTLDASCFRYLLKDGIVSQADSTGNTFFVNSGKIKQLGVEAAVSWFIIPPHVENSFFKRLRYNGNYTYSRFRYEKYQMKGQDYSGNRVPGVPRTTWINSLYFGFPANISLFVQHNFTSRIPLNDANSAFARAYHLLSAKFGIHFRERYLPHELFFFADNILNERYSLGNDLNAIGGRYYNAAPAFNFQVGVLWKL